MRSAILLTGFDPFGGESVNPATELLGFFEGKTLAGHLVATQQIPTVRHKAEEKLKEAVMRVDPDLIISVGLGGGRFAISPERIAINVDDFRIPDNEGNQPVDEPVVMGGPAAYFTRLPVKAMVHEMRRAGIPAVVSNTAGTFLCNHIFYSLMHLLAQEGNARRGGFIHIPYLPEQAARLGNPPSMAMETLVKGMEIALDTAARVMVDIKESGGIIA